MKTFTDEQKAALVEQLRQAVRQPGVNLVGRAIAIGDRVLARWLAGDELPSDRDIERILTRLGKQEVVGEEVEQGEQLILSA